MKPTKILRTALLLPFLGPAVSAQMHWVDRPSNFFTPPAREGHAMAYDDFDNRLILFGGRNSIATFGDTWSWDGGGWQQRFLGVSPSARSGHAMVYDSWRLEIVLFGGTDGQNPLRDTWVYNGRVWRKIFTPKIPPARFEHAMAFDTQRGRVVLYGGIDENGNTLGDTWEFNGTNWEELTPASNNADPAFSHAMAYEPNLGKTMLFGGMSRSETWVWDGSIWVKFAPVNQPENRTGHIMVYDTARRRMVMHGGVGENGVLGDSYEWIDIEWIQRAANDFPRANHAAAFDASIPEVISFGGQESVLPSDQTFGYTPTHRGSFEFFGQSCQGSSGHPVIFPIGNPILGNSDFEISFGSIRPEANVFLAISRFETAEILGDCILYAKPPFAELITGRSTSGVFNFSVPIPLDENLSGKELIMQAFVGDPEGSFNSLAFSPALRVTIGD